MSLAQEGLPSTGIGVGWEKFDDRSFGMSDFEQRVNKLRALRGIVKNNWQNLIRSKQPRSYSHTRKCDIC